MAIRNPMQTIHCGALALAVPFPRVERYRFTAEALEPISLPPYSGSAWRGLLAGTVKRLFCATGTLDCGGCEHWSGCTYHLLFELPPTDSGPRTSGGGSHPLVLDVRMTHARQAAPGDSLEVGITLIGAASALSPNLAFAMLRAGEIGLAKGRGHFRLRSIRRERLLGGGDWIDVLGKTSPLEPGCGAVQVDCPPPPEQVHVRLETPLRMQRKPEPGRKSELVGPGKMDSAVLLHNLVRRLESLDRAFGTAFDTTAWRDLRAIIPEVPLIDPDIHWWDWTRYSSRQGTRMKLGGLVGDFTLDLGDAPQLWPYLWLGQWVHIGKGTSFGLGRYRLDLPGHQLPVD